jgi:signal transduction histidine kinase/DNA-binding response OmpR family regulator/ligand-binding sensor domain-containing protein
LWKFDKKSGKFLLLQTPVSSAIKKIIKVNSNQLILVSENQGFIVYNIENNDFKVFNTSNLAGLKSNNIFETFVLNSRDFWFDSNDVGIYRFDLQTLKLNQYNVNTDDASTVVFPPRTMVFEDIHGRTWIQPKGGGFSLYNSATKQLEPFFNSKTSTGWRFSNLLHSAYTDNQGNLWFCTRSHGLEKVVFDKNFFKTTKINNEINSVTANDVRSVFQDDESNLWVATKDGKLTIYDKNKKFIGRLSQNGKIVKDPFFHAMVYCMMQDKDKNIWLGTKSGGLYKLKRNATGKDFEITNFVKDLTDVYSLSDNNIYSIFQDSKGRMWVGTYGGGLNLVQQLPNGKTIFINHHNNLKNYPVDIANRIRFITQNRNGNIAIGTTGGLVMFSPDFSSPENIEFKCFARKPGNTESLTNNDVHGICITQKGEMFLATFGGGLNKVIETDKKGFPTKFKSFNTTDGLPSDVTLAIVEDEFGKLWISSENNLSKFDPEKEVFETFAEIKRLMSTNNFSEASTSKLNSGELVFGCSNGIISFSPRQIINNSYRPNIVFSNLQIFNKNVEIGMENSPLKSDINSIRKLVLTHKQNFINIEFAALDFVDPENILYAFKLDGFDPDWNYVQKQRIANYTNLPKGNYVFRVKSTNSEGVWVENERSLAIEVLPSFWETGWAYFLYLLLFAGLIFLIVRILFTFFRLRANVALEKKMSEMKLRFFTDISHEIRTPLTMITAPVDYLLNDRKTPDDMKKQLKNISQNTNRMLRLVNQILDFRKIQFMHLKVQEIEFAHAIEEIFDNFSEIADEQHINFKLINNAENTKVWVDPDCLEKIVVNLLSNAFKFTSPGKAIQVTVSADEKLVSVEVKDEGIGMSKEKQKNLFVRFASFNEDKSKPSTGIGLSMVKDLADKHAAKVSVVSEAGKGSCFTVSFLQGIAHFDKNVEIIAQMPKELQPELQTELTSTPECDKPEAVSATNKQDNKFTVLVVEDDDDLRHFIKDIIEAEYFIYEAVDGQDGWEKAQKYSPDFIVSDIMMPRMDGIELLQKLKTNINTSHIPVVLLTAKTTIESKLEGLSFGADDYITKPFSVPYFQARIANLIQQRKLLQELFREGNHRQSPQEFNPQPYAITSQDENFMKKVLVMIEENMENSEMTVEELGQNMMMSRSVFFKKIKALTGFAPVEFIRDMKMKRAAQILSSGQYMVKEVSYLIGISDTKYFAKCFKAKYGITPLEYKNKSSASF